MCLSIFTRTGTERDEEGNHIGYKILEYSIPRKTLVSPFRQYPFGFTGPWISSRQDLGLTPMELMWNEVNHGYHLFSDEEGSIGYLWKYSDCICLRVKVKPEHFVVSGMFDGSKSFVATQIDEVDFVNPIWWGMSTRCLSFFKTEMHEALKTKGELV